jgi:hypothetical protein
LLLLDLVGEGTQFLNLRIDLSLGLFSGLLTGENIIQRPDIHPELLDETGYRIRPLDRRTHLEDRGCLKKTLDGLGRRLSSDGKVLLERSKGLIHLLGAMGISRMGFNPHGKVPLTLDDLILQGFGGVLPDLSCGSRETYGRLVVPADFLDCCIRSCTCCGVSCRFPMFSGGTVSIGTGS